MWTSSFRAKPQNQPPLDRGGRETSAEAQLEKVKLLPGPG